jgi:hypothetical protein
MVNWQGTGAGSICDLLQCGDMRMSMLSAKLCGDSKNAVNGRFFGGRLCALGGRLWGEADDERNTALVSAVDGDLDAVVSGFFELQVLDIDDEVSRENAGVAIEVNFGGDIDVGHDRLAVVIYEVDADGVLAFFDPVKDDPQGDGAMGVDGGEFGGDDGVEGA